MSKRLATLMFVATLAIGAGLSGSIAAPPRIELPGVEALAGMKDSLKLTDDQVARLQPVITARIEQVDAALAALEAADEPDVAGFIKQYGDIRKGFDDGVMKILTLDQRGPWESYKVELEQGLVTGNATKQLANLKSALKLSDDQVTRLRPAVTAAIQGKLDLFQKLAASGHIDIREKHRAWSALDKLNEDLEKSIYSVLLLDQRPAFKEMTGKK